MGALPGDPATPQPCIRCGECARVCPVGLLPQQLHAWIRLDAGERLQEYGLQACVECGRCDLACPSRIPLAAQFRGAKAARAAQDAARANADAARARYQARNLRLAREAEQRAREQATRHEAASADAVQAALARARARKRDPGTHTP